MNGLEYDRIREARPELRLRSLFEALNYPGCTISETVALPFTEEELIAHATFMVFANETDQIVGHKQAPKDQFVSQFVHAMKPLGYDAFVSGRLILHKREKVVDDSQREA